ncbi:MAG TPA: hypothetical protein VD978_14830 [Azospirillum sp.]|nr:hypothetical protein [Azospirillum sp.]
MTDKTELAFFITESHAGWIVRADGALYGPYTSFANALTGAIHEAQAAGLCGFASVVLAASGFEEPYEALWTYGRDAYPPYSSDEVRHATPHL